MLSLFVLSYTPIVLLHFYIFLTGPILFFAMGERKGFCFFTCPFKITIHVHVYLPISTFYMLTSNYYKMHWIYKINDTTLLPALLFRTLLPFFFYLLISVSGKMPFTTGNSFFLMPSPIWKDCQALPPHTLPQARLGLSPPPRTRLGLSPPSRHLQRLSDWSSVTIIFYYLQMLSD